MSIEKTLFIVGAGASAELELPIGDGLKEIIAEKVNIQFDDPFGRNLKSGEYSVLQALREFINAQKKEDPNYKETFIATGQFVRDAIGLSPSIDYFLSSHSDNSEVHLLGKLGITCSILEAESKSDLWVDHRESANGTPNLDLIKDTWYSKIFMMLSRGCNPSQFKNNLHKVDFIVFNYDRCIEQSFFHKVKRLYRLNDSQASDLLKPLNIIHPYGTVGDLPWQNSEKSEISYGETNLSPEKLLDLSSNIITYTEQMRDKGLVSRMQSLVQNANTVVFLGFGYHEQNMALLSPDHSEVRRVFATAYEESAVNRNYYEDSILKSLKSNAALNINVVDSSCFKLFSDFEKVLFTNM